MSARYPYIGDIIKLKKQVGPYSPGKRGVITDVGFPVNEEKFYVVKFKNMISGNHHYRNLHRSDFVVPRTQVLEPYSSSLFDFSGTSAKKRAKYKYDDKEII